VSIAERVERGAALLDAKRPGWWRDIGLGRLDIKSSCDCIAGQLGDYARTVEALGLYEYDAEAAHGFEAEESQDEYPALTEAWRDLILGRREQAQVPA
jgi:hypothetical protein